MKDEEHQCWTASKGHSDHIITTIKVIANSLWFGSAPLLSIYSVTVDN